LVAGVVDHVWIDFCFDAGFLQAGDLKQRLGSGVLYRRERDNRRSFDCGVCDAFAQDDNFVKGRAPSE
jgi:hypothetical protein